MIRSGEKPLALIQIKQFAQVVLVAEIEIVCSNALNTSVPELFYIFQ